MILFFLNVGAMIGPSWQDLKNIWPMLIILLFFSYSLFDYLGFLAIVLILINILIQISFIIIIKIIKLVFGSLVFN